MATTGFRRRSGKSGSGCATREAPRRILPACVTGFLLIVAAAGAAPSQPSGQGQAIPAPRVGSLHFDGRTAFSAQEISGWIATREKDPFSAERIRQDLLTIVERYRAAGYYAASAHLGPLLFSEDSSTVDLTVEIAEGKQTVLAAIHLEGARSLSTAEFARMLESRTGDPLDVAVLESDLAALLDRYDRGGFPLADCRIDSITIRPAESVDSAYVHVRVTEGPRVLIDELRVEGNKETRTGVILREARLQPGEPYHPARVSAIRQRLIRLNIFSQVSEPALYMRDDHGGLLIRVQEGSTNTFDGVIGYAPESQPGEGGYVTGLVSISRRNLFGTGRKMNLRWQKEDRNTQDLAVAYLEPWLFDLPVNAGGEFLQRRQDTTFVRQAGRIRGELMISEEFSVSVVGGSESVIPSSDTLTTRIPRSSTLTIGGEALYDTRDDLYTPTGGARYRADYHYGRKRMSGSTVEGTANISIQRFGIDLEFYVAPFTQQVIALGLHGRQVQGGDVDESEMFRFGGANTLRGYRENQFLGSRVAWTNTEYRIIVGRRSFLYGFFDTGYYSRPGDVTRALAGTEAFHYGYGVGMRFDTPLGNLGVSFALGKGDSFAQGKVHFGIINEF
ncbi:MAG: BamA/TamA family outer membrane protein [Bacteroidetes bacterium]|nr:BamA/TamA family outer membrane protein [Bacteroidota bacterium]